MSVCVALEVQQDGHFCHWCRRVDVIKEKLCMYSGTSLLFKSFYGCADPKNDFDRRKVSKYMHKDSVS